jgi:hypothetical protein
MMTLNIGHAQVVPMACICFANVFSWWFFYLLDNFGSGKGMVYTLDDRAKIIAHDEIIYLVKEYNHGSAQSRNAWRLYERNMLPVLAHRH